MTTVITGATGFIARNLLDALARRGESVIAISRQPPNNPDDKGIRWHALPKSTDDWKSILEDGSTIYHCAWSTLPQSSNQDPISDASANILGTLQLLTAAKGRKDLRIVFPSSGGTVYGVLNSLLVTEEHPTNPRCAYGVSKLAIEKYLILHRDLWGLDSVSLRISNAYGPRQEVMPNFGAISTFAARALRGEPITIFGDGSIIRDYVYIDDLVEAMILAGEFRHGPPVMNIGSGAGKSLNDIVIALSGVLGRQIAVKYIAKRDFDVPVSVLDVSLARATLNWMPSVSFEAGIASTLRAAQVGRVINYAEGDAARP